MAITHLDMEREFLRLLSTEMISRTTAFATVQCLKELQTRARAYTGFLPIPDWMQGFAQCDANIDEMIDGLTRGGNVQHAMRDQDFMCSPVYQSQLLRVNQELLMRPLESQLFRVNDELFRRPRLQALVTEPREEPAELVLMNMNTEVLTQTRVRLEKIVKQLQLCEDMVALSFWSTEKRPEETRRFNAKHPTFRRAQHSFTVTRLILVRACAGWLQSWQERMTDSAVSHVQPIHTVFKNVVETYLAAAMTWEDQSGWMHMLTQDTGNVLHHLVEAQREGVLPNQDQAEFQLGCLRLASFLIQLSPPGALDDDEAR